MESVTTVLIKANYHLTVLSDSLPWANRSNHAFRTCAVSISEVSSLHHELLDDTVEFAPFVTESFL